MKISIFTATGHYNLGDELILLKEYEFLKAYFLDILDEDISFDVFTYDKQSSLLPNDKDISYVSYFPNSIRKHPLRNLIYLWRTIKSISSSDIVIIGGGGLIYADEVQKGGSPIWQWKLRVFLAKLFGKSIIWLAVGISYPEDRLKEISYLFRGKNTSVSVRDKQSKSLLEKIQVTATLLDDPVFMIDPSDEKGKEKTIGISLRRGYIKDEHENIKQMVLYLTRKGYNLKFLSHSIHQDDILADDADFLKEFANIYRIPLTKNLKETLNAYKEIDMIIGMRFHSMILATINSIPFLAISYGQKTKELLEDLSYDFALNPKKFDFEEFIRIFERLEKSRNEAKFALKSKYDTIKANIGLEYKRFFDGFQ